MKPLRPRTFFTASVAAVLLAASLPSLWAGAVMTMPVVNIVDTTPGTSTVDGTVNGGEYIGFGTGINGGFGDVWGNNSQLHFDSDLSGAVNFGFIQGSSAFNDVAVIYIDSVAGGFTSTFDLGDNMDAGRAAISGFGTNGTEFSQLNFAPGFEADFGVAWDGAGNVTLFGLAAGGSGSLNPLGSLSLTSATMNHFEGSFDMTDIGSGPGGSFKYIVTYLNPTNAFRSDEFHGENFPSGNPGNGVGNEVTLTTFNTFQSIPEPSGAILVALTGLLATARRRR